MRDVCVMSDVCELCMRVCVCVGHTVVVCHQRGDSIEKTDGCARNVCMCFFFPFPFFGLRFFCVVVGGR